MKTGREMLAILTMMTSLVVVVVAVVTYGTELYWCYKKQEVRMHRMRWCGTRTVAALPGCAVMNWEGVRRTFVCMLEWDIYTFIRPLTANHSKNVS